MYKASSVMPQCAWTVLAGLLLAGACSSGQAKNDGTDSNDTSVHPSSDSRPPSDSESIAQSSDESETMSDSPPMDSDTQDTAPPDSASSVDTSLEDSDTEDTQPRDSDTRVDTSPDDKDTVDTLSEDSDTAIDTASGDTNSEDTGPKDSETESETVSPPSKCSEDLHDRVDENGHVIETCPPDQGCLNGICVPACTAVAALHGNVGCDFLIPRPPIAIYTNPCFAVFVANNWNKSAALSLSHNATPYDVHAVARVPVSGLSETNWNPLAEEGVPALQGAVLFLEGGPDQELGCPVVPAMDTNTAVVQTGRGRAWHIVTDTPVAVYDILPYGGSKSFVPSAELVLPTTAWKTNYLAVVPPFQPFPGGAGNPGSQWGQITALEDATTVTVSPSVDLPAGTDVLAAPVGAATSYTLNSGEYLQWKQNWKTALPMDLTGSKISADKPVSFAGGNEFLCIATSTSTGGGCDSAHQQIPPISAWGNRYAVAPYATRRTDGGEESLLYRIVGGENDTVLTYDPPIDNAPTSVMQGSWVDFEAEGAFSVESQDNDHPFYLAQMMSGWGITGSMGDLGDEEYVNLVPPAQYRSSYVFFTDMTYKTTTLTLVQCDEGSGFFDVNLQCLNTPISAWTPIGLSGNCRFSTVDLVRGNMGHDNCKNGPQYAFSEGKFGLTVWGLDTASSYAYPAGAMVSKINEVVIPVI